MRRPALVALALVMFALGAMLAVFVAGSASAASPKTTTTKSTSKTPTSKAASSTVPTPTYTTTTTESPGDSFFVINGTVNAASDHEIVGSSAFPNFTTGAVDNYYSMAHSHLDNSPFAEGTASPADTGPIGQTAAAGNTQQPQYADARWPGDSASGKATYGSQGGPYATAEAGEYRATADASEATNGLSGPGLGGKKTLPVPVGFDGRLRQALAGWKTKWQDVLGLKKTVSPQKPSPTVTTPVGTVTVPTVTIPQPGVTTPVVTVTAPTPPSAGTNPAPPVPVPTTTLSSASAQGASRSLAARPVTRPAAPAPSSSPGDGESLLTSSTQAFLVETAAKKTDATTTGATTTTKTKTATTGAATTDKPKKNYALVTSGESSLGRVSLGGGQIVIEGIHVKASITNDGTPSYKAAVSVASATIGGVPVTIDQDGVHLAGQGQGLPYQQASDSLNGALNKAGIHLFLVGPEVTTCGQSGAGSGTDTSTTSTTSSDQSGTTSSCGGQGGGMCDQSGAGNGTGTGGSGPPLPGSTTTSTDQSGTTSSCGGQAGGMCDQSGAGTGGGTGGTPGLPGSTTTSTNRSGTSTTPSSCDQTCNQSAAGSGTGSGPTTTATTTSRTTTTTSSNQSGGTTTSGSCGGTGLPSTTSSCASGGTGTGTTTTSNNQAGETTTTGSSDQFNFGLGGGTSNAGEMTVTATGVHVVFTQPVNQSGVPSQYVEHILGEVFVDSLATPATPAGDLPDLGFSSSSSSSPSFSSSCLRGGHSGGATSGVSAAGSSSSAGGSSFPSGFASSQPTSSSAGSPLGHAMAGVASMLRTKPMWVLLAFLVWQALAIGTGASLWYWRKGGAS